ncbi:MAG: hypothetical protein WD716_07315 [Fimbriimonadaceae bacterium]
MSKESKVRAHWKWISIAIVIIACSTALFVLLRQRSSEPYGVEIEFLASLRERDWSGIYDISVRDQFEKSGISKSQFVNLMGSASAGLPDSYFQDLALEEMGPKERDYSRGVHAVLLTFKSGPEVEGAKVQQVLHVKRSSDGWHIAINELPFRIVRLHNADAESRWGRLATCLEGSGITEYWMGVNGPVLHTAQIRKYLGRKISADQLYKQVPR